MKVLVTGGAGHVGKGVVARLMAEGIQVRVVDAKPDSLDLPVEAIPCDITDFDAIRRQVSGQDAIIHLAAIPTPRAGLGHEIFRVNACGTFNVFEAAAQEGIRRVVCASSINALGVSYGIKPFPVHYFPIDEDHPPFTTDPYSFSKQITEEIAAYYWRREGISGCCLRMPWVYRMNDELARQLREWWGHFQRLYRRIQDLPADERRTWLEGAMQRFNERRAMRLQELTPQGLPPEPPIDPDDPFILLIYGYTDFWAILSLEDAAEAYLRALLADYEGSHPLFVTEAHNLLGIEAENLAAAFYPQVTRRTRPMPGACSLIGYNRASELIGYEPKSNFFQFQQNRTPTGD